jgi:hypothetical protein
MRVRTVMGIWYPKNRSGDYTGSGAPLHLCQGLFFQLPHCNNRRVLRDTLAAGVMATVR